MSNTGEIMKIAHRMTGAFLEAVNQSNSDVLRSEFGVADVVHEELFDYINSTFNEGNINLSVPPFELILERNGQEWLFMIYGEEDEDECWGVESVLLNNNIKTEFIIHFDLFKNHDGYRLKYLYIGS
jgi:hypothetical protein